MNTTANMTVPVSPAYQLHALGAFDAKVFSHICDVPADEWDALAAKRSLSFTHSFWEVITSARLNDFAYRHVMLYRSDGMLAAVATFYTVTTDSAIFAPRLLRGLLARVRRLWPGFLMLRMLECGTPVVLNSPGYSVAEEQSLEEVTQALDQLLAHYAHYDRALLIVVRDFEPESIGYQQCFVRRNYALLPSLPNTYLDIPWKHFSAYLGSLKSYYRSKQIKHVKRIEALGIRCEPRSDFAALAEQLFEQWLVVHRGAGEFAREVLTPEFYRNLSQRFGGKAQVLLFYQNEVLQGHVLLLHEGAMTRWLYFGRAQAANDSLYIYAGHQVIKAAIAAGASRLELGLTTYPVKQDLGALLCPISLAIRAPSRLVNCLIPLLYPLMNRIPCIPQKDVFKAAQRPSTARP